jgi:hypothetical protein
MPSMGLYCEIVRPPSAVKGPDVMILETNREAVQTDFYSNTREDLDGMVKSVTVHPALGCGFPLRVSEVLV